MDVDPVVFLRPYKERPGTEQTDPAGVASTAEGEPPARKEKRRAKGRAPGEP